MKKLRLGTLAMGWIGMASLLVYVLACTSFSPDDSKLLYTTLESNGDVSISVYDRKQGQSEKVFVHSAIPDIGITDRKPSMLRPYWLPDGKRVLVLWQDEANQNHSSLNCAVFPVTGNRGAYRQFSLGEVASREAALLYPPVVARDQLFLVGTMVVEQPKPLTARDRDGGKTNSPPVTTNVLVRVNLSTGEIRTNGLKGDDVVVFPSGNENKVFYFSDSCVQSNATEIGLLDTLTGEQTAVFQISKDDKLGDDASFAFSSNVKKLFVLAGKEDKWQLWQHQSEGKPALVREVPTVKEDSIRFGVGCMNANNDLFYATYMKNVNETNRTVGIVEIPLDKSPIRYIPLIENASGISGSEITGFQMGLSHDGAVAAVCSAYMAADSPESWRPADCALFLVDMKSPGRTVTRVPIPLPAKTK